MRAKPFYALAGFADHKQRCENRHELASLEKCGKHGAVHRRRDFKTGFVGLNLDHRFTGRDRLALLLDPPGNKAFFHRIAQLRHFHRNCHLRLLPHLLISVRSS
jgi:hypothetical protein